jgi:hypothetical protein
MTLPQFAPLEKSIWTSGSFAPPLIVILCAAFTSNSVPTIEKYVIVTFFLGVIPVVVSICSNRPQFAWLKSATGFIPLNLAFTLTGVILLIATELRPELPVFNPRLLAISYVAGVIIFLLKVHTLPIKNELIGWVTIALISTTPVLFAAATILPAEWHLAKPLNVRAGVVGAILAVGLIIIWRQPAWRWFGESNVLKWMGLVAILAAPFAMLDGELDYDALHYTAYLGPATAVSAGRVPLVDVFCQYGQAYILYNLAFTWLPWTYGSAALVTSILNLLYTASFLIILRRMVQHHFAFLILATTLPFFFWLIYHYSPNVTPSQGGMRYLSIAVLGAVLVWMPPRRLFSVLSIATILICWTWSFEAAIYGTFVYFAFALATVASNTSDFRVRMVQIAQFALSLLGIFVASFFVVAVLYLALFHELPRYDLYVSMILAYVGPDPFMDYAYFKEGFLGWAPLLTSLFPVAWLISRQVFERDATSPDMLPQFAVTWAITCVMSLYCLISTQGFILKVALMPFLILAYAAVERSFANRRDKQIMTVSEIGIAPVFVFLVFLLSGVSVANFVGSPAYASPNTSLLRHLISDGHPFRRDLSVHLRNICNENGVLEPGNVCSGDPNIPAVHYNEFANLISKWQSDDQSLLIFHPVDAILSVTLRKPHALPVSFSYVDGFSPALFRYILQRAEPVIQNRLHAGQMLIATKDLQSLNELEWALLNRIANAWTLERVAETEHFAVYRLLNDSTAAGGPLITLPNRTIKTRNGF